MTTLYDPEHWLETAVRALKDYIVANINTRIYDVVMEFPGAIVDAEKMPLKKTIIHFEIDAIDSMPVGLGENIFAQNYDPALQQITPQTAEKHVINFDVGVWASDGSGGLTSRLRARQMLSNLLGIGGIAAFRAATDGGDGGIEILSYTGGRFTTDTSANDFRLYRMIDGMLEVRVFSRSPQALPIPTIETIDQASGLTISE